jgi:hypothetical protein
MTAYSDPSGTAPVRFARDDITVILRRAAELSHERVPADETLTGRDLAEIADEVGMSRPAVAIAMAETRSGVTPPGSLIDRLVGPRQVWAHCQTTRHESEARQAVRQWLEVNHGLAVHEDGAGVITATPRQGALAALGDGMRRLQGMGGLSEARSVRASAASVDDVHAVCVAADIGNRRRGAMAGGSAVAVAGSTVVGVTAIVATPLALVALPVTVGLGVVTARRVHAQTTQRVSHQVVITTESAARGDQPDHPVDALLRHGRRLLPSGRRRHRSDG